MSVGLIASFVAPAVVGAGIGQAVWARRPLSGASGDRLAGRLLVGALGFPLGLGLCSCLYFAWLILFGQPGAGLAIAECALVLGVWGVARQRPKGAGPEPAVSPQESGFDQIGTGAMASALPWVLAVTAVCAIAGFVVTALASPHGAWDAWMTWNLGARFLHRGGNQWTLAFSETLRHPDYPLLIQGAVARAWYYARADTVAAPAAIGFVFTAATVALTWSAVAVMRSRAQAHLAALVLLGTTFLVLHGASQYADVPVGWYLLAALVLFWLYDRHQGTPGFVLLAGLMAGLGGWTKNEGLLFFAALALARCVAVWPAGGSRRCIREMTWFVAGAAPALLLILYFKLQLAPANYLLSAGDHGLELTLGRVLEVERYRFLAGAVKRELVAFGDTGLAGPIWLLTAYLLCTGIVQRPRWEPAMRMAVLVGCLVAMGHLLVLLVAPGDMPRLASASLNRLILQLWPAAVLTTFMVTAGLGVRTAATVHEGQWT